MSAETTHCIIVNIARKSLLMEILVYSLLMLHLLFNSFRVSSLGTRRCCNVDSTSQQRRVPNGGLPERHL